MTLLGFCCALFIALTHTPTILAFCFTEGQQRVDKGALIVWSLSVTLVVLFLMLGVK